MGPFDCCCWGDCRLYCWRGALLLLLGLLGGPLGRCGPLPPLKSAPATASGATATSPRLRPGVTPALLSHSTSEDLFRNRASKVCCSACCNQLKAVMHLNMHYEAVKIVLEHGKLFAFLRLHRKLEEYPAESEDSFDKPGRNNERLTKMLRGIKHKIKSLNLLGSFTSEACLALCRGTSFGNLCSPSRRILKELHFT